MSRHRFEQILKHLRFSDQPDHRNAFVSDTEHWWRLVDDFVYAVNTDRARRFQPGSILCIDESMIRWYGLGGSWILEGLPHYVSIDRKPDSGCEIQDSCCGVTGILCQLLVVKSESNEEGNGMDNQDQTSNPITNKKGINAVFRLTEPWHRSGRTVVGDSAFSSVGTCVQLNKVNMGYIGMVKQATKYFPMKPLQHVILPHKGNYIGMSMLVEEHKIAAYAWRDRERRYFVASASSLAEGKPYERIRRRETGDGHGNRQANDVFIMIPMPKATEVYFNAANKIDCHNRIRAECGIDKHF